jgi:hypothetical protein
MPSLKPADLGALLPWPRLRPAETGFVCRLSMDGVGRRHPVCNGVDVIAVSVGLVTRKDTYLDYINLTERIGEMPTISAAV